MTSQRSTVVGVFTDQVHARAAISDLQSAGFRDDQLGLITPDATRTVAGTARAATGTQWEEGAGIGAAAGAATGFGLGLAVAAGLIPGVGPVIASGTLMALIASAGAGATVGTILGALVGLGVPEEEASYYEGEFKAGRTILTVKADARTAEAEAVLRRHGAYDMYSAGTVRTGGAVNVSVDSGDVVGGRAAGQGNP
jgi:hypothetical protein